MTRALARFERGVDAGFGAVVSPYHLTTREPAAMAMLQLAERAVTLLLAPLAEREGVGVGFSSVRREAARTPVYQRYMSSWRWAEQLFREGVIASVVGEDDPVERVRGVCAHIAGEAGYSPLLAFMRPGLFEDDRAYLAAASADVLKGGPDPGVSIPIAAGLDAFGADHGLVVSRSAPVSLVQRAEARLGRVVFRFTVPVLVQASSDRVLLVRALLSRERECLARGIGSAFAGGGVDRLRDAARAYAAGFEREREDICSPPARGEDDEVRVVVDEVAVVGMELPGDAVLRSSLSVAGGGPPRAAGGVPDSGTVRTMCFRALGG